MITIEDSSSLISESRQHKCYSILSHVYGNQSIMYLKVELYLCIEIKNNDQQPVLGTTDPTTFLLLLGYLSAATTASSPSVICTQAGNFWTAVKIYIVL